MNLASWRLFCGLQDLFQGDGWGRNQILVEGIKVKKQKETSREALWEVLLWRGTENWGILKEGNESKGGLKHFLSFSHLGIHPSSLALRLSCHQLTGGFVYNVFLQEPSFLPKPSLYQGTFSSFISLESLINAFCFFKW